MVILGCYLQENSSDQTKATKIGSWRTSVQATQIKGKLYGQKQFQVLSKITDPSEQKIYQENTQVS